MPPKFPSCVLQECQHPGSDFHGTLAAASTTLFLPFQELHAHSQFCISGDNTLEAADHAIKTIIDEDADEHFVIVLSDANLERYGIRPKAFSDILSSNEDVNAYVIFIGSLGDQASR